MKKLSLKLNLLALCAIFFIAPPNKAKADYYKVTVTRVDQDLYRIEDQSPTIYIVTQFCYVYAYSANAILNYNQYSYSNKLIFIDQNQSCQIEKLLQ